MTEKPTDVTYDTVFISYSDAMDCARLDSFFAALGINTQMPTAVERCHDCGVEIGEKRYFMFSLNGTPDTPLCKTCFDARMEAGNAQSRKQEGKA